MPLLVLPLRDLVETFLSRREKQRIKELARHAKQRKTKHTESLRNAIKNGVTAGIVALLKNGADVDVVVDGCNYATLLQLASQREDIELVKATLAYSAAVDIRGGKYETALQTASYSGNHQIVKLLLEKGADLNAQAGGEYRMALQAASLRAHVETVALLLDKGTDLNVQGGSYGTAKQLLDKGVDSNVEGTSFVMPRIWS
ncbi:ankyrin repeat-containing domain protein, partial [Mycena leptocephala]